MMTSDTSFSARPRLIAAACSGFLIALGAVGAQDENPALVAPTGPLPPDEERAKFRLPDGFEAQLFAAEPDINKPMNLAFDDRGRLWVTSTVEYPYAVPLDKPGRDAIKVLEDTDGDGRADKVTTFADGLNIPIGILPVRNGCIAWSIPNIWFFEDTDRDGVSDKRTKLYGPLGFEKDTHGMSASYRRGLDGWLYSTHGFNNTSTVRGADGSEVQLHSGNTIRLRLDGSRVEQHTHGQVNPFGLAWDRRGNLYSADCHSSPVYQLLRGAYYPSFGKPHDGLGFAPAMIRHAHGSTGIAGAVVLDDDRWPEKFRGNILLGNVVTNRINRDSIEEVGATPVAVEQADFLVSDDRWFRPVDLQLGPDGALYVADFYNKIIGHYEVPLEHPGRDRERGRIWRIVYTGDKGARPAGKLSEFDLEVMAGPAAAEKLGDPNITVRYLATHALADRFRENAGAVVRSMLNSGNAGALHRAHGLWVLHRCGQLDSAAFQSALSDDDPLVRVHAARVLGELPAWGIDEHDAALRALQDDDPHVRKAAMLAIGKHPEAKFLAPLLAAEPDILGGDTHLRHVLRMTVRDVLEDDGAFEHLATLALDERTRAVVADVALAVKSPAAAGFLVAWLRESGRPENTDVFKHVAAAVPPAQRELVVAAARSVAGDDPAAQLDLAAAVADGIGDFDASVSAWLSATAGGLLQPDDDPDLAVKALEAVAKLNLTGRRADVKSLADAPSAERRVRAAAARTFAVLEESPARYALAAAAADPAVPDRVASAAASAAVGDSPDDAFSEILRGLPSRVQGLAASELASSAAGIEFLFAAIDSGVIPAGVLQDPQTRQKVDAADNGFPERAQALTAALPPRLDAIDETIQRIRESFDPAAASSERGQAVFSMNCAVCHQLDGTGGVIGPQLDGIGARGPARLLEDILDPNRQVDPAFHLETLTLDDGSLVAGLVKAESDRAVTVADPAGNIHDVPTAKITRRQTSTLSLMPPAYAQLLDDEQIRDLLGFLISHAAPPEE